MVEAIGIAIADVGAVGVVIVIVLVLSMRARIDREARRTSASRDGYPRGWRECGVCGNLYKPLNDEKFSPELDICRDCLWKMYYGDLFEGESSRK